MKPLKSSKKVYEYTVKKGDTATFENEQVHAVCSTFTLAREVEWATRQFVKEILDEDEEGIGTELKIEHLSPARVGEKLVIHSFVKSLNKNRMVCSFEVKTKDRLVARGATAQKILKKHKLEEIFSSL